jgi:hypothetical protein
MPTVLAICDNSEIYGTARYRIALTPPAMTSIVRPIFNLQASTIGYNPKSLAG